jgi:hypothetical protein
MAEILLLGILALFAWEAWKDGRVSGYDEYCDPLYYHAKLEGARRELEVLQQYSERLRGQAEGETS